MVSSLLFTFQFKSCTYYPCFRLYNKFKRDNWCEKELREIARVLNCKLEYNFVLNDSGERF